MFVYAREYVVYQMEIFLVKLEMQNALIRLRTAAKKALFRLFRIEPLSMKSRWEKMRLA